MGLRARFSANPDKVRNKAAARLGRVDKGVVLDHLDAAMSGAWKAAEDFRKDELAVYLDEAERGLQQALGALDALRQRAGA
ncbi:hypothetical protein [Microbispora sp. NPDC049633]|uniref:hypothetical protein n=1 Tax=Microbispora sp. NPDC049633 TaxID=3154355 RepID=UPI003418102B